MDSFVLTVNLARFLIITITALPIIIFLTIYIFVIYICNSKKWKEKIEAKGGMVMSYRDLNPRKKKYYREIPCQGDLYYINGLINLIYDQSEIDNTRLIKSIFLNWIYKGIISLDEKNENFIIHDEIKIENDLDRELLDIIKEIAQDNILEKKEFKIIDKDISKKIIVWYVKMWGYTDSKLRNTASKLKHEEIRNIQEFKNYLLDYSMINERKIEEVQLWEQYLVIANLLGISEQIEKEFKIYIPNGIIINWDWEIFKYLFVKTKEALKNNENKTGKI